MLVALEGVDGSGKSTLAAAVCAYALDRYENVSTVQLIHFGPPEGDPLDEMLDEPSIAAYQPGERVAVISDRLHFGCPVYAPIYRPEKCVDEYGDLGKAGWRYMELFLESRGCLTVMVRSPRSRERVEMRGDDYIDPVHIDDLRSRYAELASESITLGATVDMRERDQIRPAAVSITHAALAKERWATVLSSHRGYIGKVDPDVLVIMQPDRAARLEVLGAVDDADWKDVGIASAQEPQDSLADLIEVLGFPTVIGFGRLPGHVENEIARQRGWYAADLDGLVELVHRFTL